jgi:hypothetical protein
MWRAKYFGVILIIMGIPTLILDASRKGSDMPLLAGLFITFISNEKHQDERASLLKGSSALLALVIGYSIKLLVTNLHSHELLSNDLTEINHFLILVFGIALIIFYTRFYFNLK